MSEPKKHHYLSQFYLAGFTIQNSNEGQLFCYDINTKVVRPSKPMNEGFVKQFNKIESYKNDPNILEKELAKIQLGIV